MWGPASAAPASRSLAQPRILGAKALRREGRHRLEQASGLWNTQVPPACSLGLGSCPLHLCCCLGLAIPVYQQSKLHAPSGRVASYSRKQEGW